MVPENKVYNFIPETELTIIYMYLLYNTDINECLASPCQNGGSCVDLEDGYRCICTDKFDGPTCRYGKDYNVNDK